MGGVLLAAVSVLILAAGALVVSTLPGRSGHARVPGIRSSVRIETDAHGIPTIRAATLDDALFGLGFVHARERLWQMEFQRRVGAGRLAEILGERLVSTDRFLRTVGFRRAAESALASLSPAARSRVRAYRSGINAYLVSSRTRPPEARLLRVSIEPFDDVDCVVWLKLMAWDLSGNATAEIRRAKLIAKLGAERTRELLVPAPETPTILRDGEWTLPTGMEGPAGSTPSPPSAAPSHRRHRRTTVAATAENRESGFSSFADPLELLSGGFGGESIGSNSWVVSGARTRSRLPLLANDPHLGLRAPAVFFLVRLETPELSVEGATLPGVPGVVIGRTSRIAWGLTALEPDVEDLFLELPDPTDAGRYLWNGRSVPFETRTETIAVRGRAAERLVVRSTVHGPIVTDVIEGAVSLGAPVSLRWTGLDPVDRSAESLLAIESARDWPGFLAAAALLHAPSMNLVYADRDGHIGYTASGAIPIRPRADGLLPVPGGGADDWSGTISFDALPRTLDPPRGFLVTANQRVVSGRYPWPMSLDFVEPYRARRIEDRLEKLPRATVEDMRSIQQDRISYQARDLLPVLLRTVAANISASASANATTSATERDALRRLATWNFDFAPGSAPAAIYAAWYAELSKMPEDELGESAAPTVRSRFVMNALASESPWCDDVRTPKRETCADFASAALSRAVKTLESRLGHSPKNWRWDRLHRARFPHAVLDDVPLLSRLASPATGQGGDGSTVNVGAYRRDGSFVMRDGPSYRTIVDLAAPALSRWVGTTGQSGNFFERGYRDFLPLWRDGKDLAMQGEPGDLKVFLLEPKK